MNTLMIFGICVYIFGTITLIYMLYKIIKNSGGDDKIIIDNIINMLMGGIVGVCLLLGSLCLKTGIDRLTANTIYISNTIQK